MSLFQYTIRPSILWNIFCFSYIYISMRHVCIRPCRLKFRSFGWGYSTLTYEIIAQDWIERLTFSVTIRCLTVRVTSVDMYIHSSSKCCRLYYRWMAVKYWKSYLCRPLGHSINISFRIVFTLLSVFTLQAQITSNRKWTGAKRRVTCPFPCGSGVKMWHF